MRYLRLAALGFVAALLVACNGGDLAPIGSSVAPHFARPNVTGASREKFAYAILDAFNTGQLTGQGTLAGLIRDSAGALYGTTYGGGTYNTGTVFKLSPSGSSYVGTTLYSFGPPPDGGQPAAQLLMDSKGALYGTTEYGGPSGSGSNTGSGIAFKLTPGSSEYTETVLHAFGPQPDGQNPRSGLIADTSGALYGTTRIGGKYNGGDGFKLTPSGSGYTESILLSFNSQNGWNPNYGNLLLGKNRTLYGTTSGNIYGSAPYGNVFELKPSGGKYRARVLYNFAGPPDGYTPVGTLVADAKGSLYGTSYYGGSCLFGYYGCGVVYKLTRSGSSYTERVLYRFQGWSSSGPHDGAYPTGSVVVDGKGALYGTTTQGGNVSTPYGTAFKLSRSRWATTPKPSFMILSALRMAFSLPLRCC